MTAGGWEPDSLPRCSIPGRCCPTTAAPASTAWCPACWPAPGEPAGAGCRSRPPDADQVVLLVLDGLGWDQLAGPARPGPGARPRWRAVRSPRWRRPRPPPRSPRSPRAARRPSTAWSATGCVVPGPSGDEVLNVLRWRTPSGDARPFVPPERVPAPAGLRRPAPSGRDPGRVRRHRVHRRPPGGGRLVGWPLPSTLVVEVAPARWPRASRSSTPTTTGSTRSPTATGSEEHYDAELVAVDRLVGDLAARLPPGAALVVTADHGQVDVGPAAVRRSTRRSWPHTVAGAAARAASAGCTPGRAGATTLVEAAREPLRRRGLGAHRRRGRWRAGWFGGPLDAEARGPARRRRPRAAPRRSPTSTRPTRATSRLVCRHGSLTADEMLVPLLAAGGVTGAVCVWRCQGWSDGGHGVERELATRGRRRPGAPAADRGRRRAVRDGRAAGQGHADRLDDQAAARRGPPGAARRGQPGPAAGDLRHLDQRAGRRRCRPTCATSCPAWRCPSATTRVPSEGELRVAQAQLVGWLEGLFHGIQATLFAQQMAGPGPARGDAPAQPARPAAEDRPPGRPAPTSEPGSLPGGRHRSARVR